MLKNLTAKSAVLSATLALACLTALPFTGKAGEEVTSPKESKNVVEETKKSCISGDLGVTFTNEYISRGLVQEKRGLQSQPYVDLYFKLYEGTGFINSITANLSFWSSIHTKRTFASADTTVPNWYEFDWDPGISIVFAKNFTLTVSYYEFDSPNGGFQTARSINTNLVLNDSDWLGAFALHPHFTFLREVDGKAGIGNQQGWYFEAGIAPSYTFKGLGAYSPTVSLPITVGWGDDRFYAGDNFGFFSVGPSISVPLAFIPSCYGSWTLSGSYLYYYLGKSAADVTNRGERDENVYSGAIGLTF